MGTESGLASMLLDHSSAAPISSCTGVVQAGGESRRFGRTKALEPLAGKRLIDWVIEVFQRLFTDMLLVTNDPQTYADLNIPTVSDARPGHGSLGGVYTGLLHSSTPWCFVTACDMPFLDEETIRRLAEPRDDVDVVVPWFNNRYETLHAFYRTTCIPEIEALLNAQRLRIDLLFAKVRTRQVTADELGVSGDWERTFFNINTLDDLARAEDLLRGER